MKNKVVKKPIIREYEFKNIHSALYDIKKKHPVVTKGSRG